MATNILPENLKGRNILRTLGLHCQWDTYLFYASIREVALPYKTIVLWFYGGGRGCIHVEIPPVRKGGKGQAVTGVL